MGGIGQLFFNYVCNARARPTYLIKIISQTTLIFYILWNYRIVWYIKTLNGLKDFLPHLNNNVPIIKPVFINITRIQIFSTLNTLYKITASKSYEIRNAALYIITNRERNSVTLCF